MLTTAVFHSVAPAAGDQRPVVVQLAPAVAGADPRKLVCSWAVDPVTGRPCPQWGPGARV
jgi:hypothetical protein